MQQIHIWADYVCPFCMIADTIIDEAVAGRDEVEVVRHSHELRPYPTPTLRPEDDYLPSIWSRAVYPMAERHGVQLRLPSVSPQPYTELAFRGAIHAQQQSREEAYHRRMFTAFFHDDLDIGNKEVLGELAEQVGLDRVAYMRALHDPATGTAHQAAMAESAMLRISVVPTVIIGGHRIDGVPTAEAIRRALDDVGARDEH